MFKKFTLATILVAASASAILGAGVLLAMADTLSLCNDSGDTCIVKKMPNGPALGTFQNPIVDDYDMDSAFIEACTAPMRPGT
jgi:hypothetical protein